MSDDDHLSSQICALKGRVENGESLGRTLSQVLYAANRLKYCTDRIEATLSMQAGLPANALGDVVEDLLLDLETYLSDANAVIGDALSDLYDSLEQHGDSTEDGPRRTEQ